MASDGEAGSTASEQAPGQLGRRLRAERQRSGMSLREVARQLGVSASFVSQIENGKSQPSVATLYSLARLLGTSIDALFRLEATESDAGAATDAAPNLSGTRQTSARGQEPGAAVISRSALGSPSAAFAREQGISRLSLVRPLDRPRIFMDSGVVWERLAGNTGQDLDFIEIIYPPHGSSTTDNRMLQHAGFEYGYLLEGELEITVGFDTFTMQAGDALGFDSAVPHLFRNHGSVPARGIWFVRHATG